MSEFFDDAEKTPFTTAMEYNKRLKDKLTQAQRQVARLEWRVAEIVEVVKGSGSVDEDWLIEVLTAPIFKSQGGEE